MAPNHLGSMLATILHFSNLALQLYRSRLLIFFLSDETPSRFWLVGSSTNALFIFAFYFLSSASLSSHYLKVNSSC